MKSNPPPGKFAYVICDPKGDDPVLDAKITASELGCSQLLNLALSKVDSKNNPTPIPVKYLKFLKENYFGLSTITNLYDVNNFKGDHFLFLYAFSNDADYGNLSNFNSNIKNKYGNAEFIPFYLSGDSAATLVLLNKFRTYLMDLYSVTHLSTSKLNSANDFYTLLSGEGSEKFSKTLEFQNRNSKDLDFLVEYCHAEIRATLTSNWII